MHQKPAGTTPFAKLAYALPPRQRVGLALVAGDLALATLKQLPKYQMGRDAFELARRWYDGEPVDLSRFEQAIHDESDHGLDINAQEAKSEREKVAWMALDTAVACAGHYGYEAIGEMATPIIYEMTEEGILDSLDDLLRRLFSSMPNTMIEAAAYLREHSGHVPFSQLKAKFGSR